MQKHVKNDDPFASNWKRTVMLCRCYVFNFFFFMLMHDFFALFVTQANPPDIQPLDDAFVLLRDHSENTTVSFIRKY